MADYKCFNSACSKMIDPSYLKKKIRCPYCGSKLVFKPRVRPTRVLAR